MKVVPENSPRIYETISQHSDYHLSTIVKRIAIKVIKNLTMLTIITRIVLIIIIIMIIKMIIILLLIVKTN